MKILKIKQENIIYYIREDLLSKFQSSKNRFEQMALCHFVVNTEGKVIKNPFSGEMLVDSFLDLRNWETAKMYQGVK